MLLAEPSGEQSPSDVRSFVCKEEKNIFPEPTETEMFSGSGSAGLPASLALPGKGLFLQVAERCQRKAHDLSGGFRFAL